MLTFFMDQVEHWDFQPTSKAKQTNSLSNKNVTNPPVDKNESREKEESNTPKGAKGQLISSGHFGVSKCTKKTTKVL